MNDRYSQQVEVVAKRAEHLFLLEVRKTQSVHTKRRERTSVGNGYGDSTTNRNRMTERDGKTYKTPVLRRDTVCNTPIKERQTTDTEQTQQKSHVNTYKIATYVSLD